MSSRDRIYVEDSEAVQKAYADLSERTMEDPKLPFQFDWEVFLAAATLGYKENSRSPLTSKKERFLWGTLTSNKFAIPMMRAIALADTKDAAVLIDDDKVATIVEEYANAGIHLLSKRLIEEGVDEIDESSLYLKSILSQWDTKEVEDQ